MDSKLRRMAILASMAVILLVSILVFYTNSEDSPNRSPNQTQGTDRTEQSQNGTGNSQNATSDGPVNGQIGNDLSAFLKDSTFFDEEINPILEAAKDNANRLSLIMTSVEKDLRIQVVDTEGNPVTGESFFVKLEGMGVRRQIFRIR